MVSLFSPCAAPPFVLQSAPVLWSPPGHAPVPLFPPGPPPPPPPFLHMTDGGNGPHNATPRYNLSRNLQQNQAYRRFLACRQQNVRKHVRPLLQQDYR